ncbi:MAG: ATP-binding protein, partial [Acidobacteria bacterium]|nr:ATP-binding protein [Acidobacteriota bacterium]
PATGLLSNVEESERDFRIRLQQACREERDRAAGALRTRYAPKIAVLEERRRRAQQAVEREKEQVTQQRLGTALSVGATLLGALFGRKALSAATIGKAGTAARSYGRLSKESQDVERASETVGAIDQQLAELNSQFEQELNQAQGKLDALAEELERVAIAPKRTNIVPRLVCLAWAPHWFAPGGAEEPAW